MKINLELTDYHGDYLIPIDGVYLVRTIEPEKLAPIYMQAYCYKYWDEMKGKFILGCPLKKQYIITHISKRPII